MMNNMNFYGAFDCIGGLQTFHNALINVQKLVRVLVNNNNMIGKEIFALKYGRYNSASVKGISACADTS